MQLGKASCQQRQPWRSPCTTAMPAYMLKPLTNSSQAGIAGNTAHLAVALHSQSSSMVQGLVAVSVVADLAIAVAQHVFSSTCQAYPSEAN